MDRQRITVWYCNCAGIVTEIGGQDWSYYGSTGTFYILHYDHLKNRMNGTRMIWRKEWIHPIVQNRPCAKNWITPKQQRRPLPFLLYWSFFCEFTILFACGKDRSPGRWLGTPPVVATTSHPWRSAACSPYRSTGDQLPGHTTGQRATRIQN